MITEEKRFPRKLKKAIFGRLMSGNKLRNLLNSVVIIPANNGYDSSQILPFAFCPKCGCRQYHTTGNMAPYPQRWVNGYCDRCGFHVIQSDNSPYYHALEFKESDYQIN